MKKDTFYFSHDYNSRNDTKIKKLIYKLGIEGYGIFWAIIEDLYNNKNVLPTDYDIISFDLRTTADKVKSVVEDFDLFFFENGTFKSESINKRLDDRDKKSVTAKENAGKRWGTDEKRNKAEKTIFYVIKMFNNNEQFIKFGITSESVSRRYSGKTPYSFDLILSCDIDNYLALEYEREFGEKFTNYTPQIKFAGSLECLNISCLDELLDFAMQKKELRNSVNNFRNAIKDSIVKESIEKKESIIPPKSAELDPVSVGEITEKPKKQPSGLHQRIIHYWYNELHPTWFFELKDTAKVKSIIKKFKALLASTPSGNDEEQVFKAFTIMCQRLPEWFKDKDLSTIDSKFNEVIEQIKNTNNGQTAKEKPRSVFRRD